MGVTYIVGAGGIGCAVGYSLAINKQTVVMVDNNPAKIEFGIKNGLRADDEPAEMVKFLHFDDWETISGDSVLLATKCYDNAVVLRKLVSGVELIPIQNGYDDALEANDHAVECIASFVAKCDAGTTHTRCTRYGELHIGGRKAGADPWPFANRLHNDFIECKVVNDIRPIKATKLMYNAAISPIAAAAGLDNGELLSLPKAQKLFFDLIEENYRILTAANVPLGKVGPFHPRTVSRILRQRWLAKLMARSFEKSLRGTYCSMAGDIEKGRTELDNYTGHLLRLAGEAIPAPINRRVYDVVSRMTRERTAPHRGVIDELMA